MGANISFLLTANTTPSSRRLEV